MRDLSENAEAIVSKIDKIVPGFSWFVVYDDVKLKWRILNILSKDCIRFLIIYSHRVNSLVSEEYEFYKDLGEYTTRRELEYLSRKADKYDRLIRELYFK